MKGPVSTSATTGIPIFQRVLETAQGGFTMSDSLIPVGSAIAAGTPIGYDETTRLAKVGKIGVLQANATNVATTYRVLKGSNLAVGMSVLLAGGTARAITVFDTSNGAYDEITVATTIGVAGTAGDKIYVNDIGATAPNGLLYMAVDSVETNQELAVVIRGTVYENRINPVPDSLKLLMPNMIFSKSF